MRDDILVARDGAHPHLRSRDPAHKHAAASIAELDARTIVLRRAASLSRAGGPLDQDHVGLARTLLFDAHAAGANGRGERYPPSLPSLGAAIGRERKCVARKLRAMAEHGLSADALWELRRRADAEAGRAP